MTTIGKIIVVLVCGLAIFFLCDFALDRETRREDIQVQNQKTERGE